ncbi:MAG: HupE/UreJ family protein [Armatimonadetes bacterium]|nr:HupE/UreJ family protein [Armatimonadota bacterium]
MSRLASRLAFVLAIFWMAALGLAHDIGLTGIELQQTPSGTTIRVMTPVSRLVERARLGPKPTPADLDLAVRSRLEVLGEGRPFTFDKGELVVDSGADMLTWTGTTKLPIGVLDVKKKFYPEDEASRTLLTRRVGNELTEERLIGAGTGSQAKAGASNFITEGIEHILSGPDHILFICGLVIIGGRFKKLFELVTGFSIAHTITLMLVQFGWVRPWMRVIEPLIALSIVLLALEAYRRQSKPEATDRSPMAFGLAFGFGLIHGFGFAGGMSAVGLSGFDLFVPVLMFNLGIEMGQLLILALAGGLVALITRFWPRARRWTLTTASIMIGMAGSYWLVERLFQR